MAIKHFTYQAFFTDGTKKRSTPFVFNIDMEEQGVTESQLKDDIVSQVQEETGKTISSLRLNISEYKNDPCLFEWS